MRESRRGKAGKAFVGFSSQDLESRPPLVSSLQVPKFCIQAPDELPFPPAPSGPPGSSSPCFTRVHFFSVFYQQHRASHASHITPCLIHLGAQALLPIS